VYKEEELHNQGLPSFFLPSSVDMPIQLNSERNRALIHIHIATHLEFCDLRCQLYWFRVQDIIIHIANWKKRNKQKSGNKASILPSPHPHTHPHPTNNPCTTFFTKLDYNCDSSRSSESSEGFSEKKNQSQREGQQQQQQQRKRISKGPKTPISKNKNTRKEIRAHLEFYFVFLGWVFLLLACLPA
jgi:hypothetical protein